jgi:hypothetical protein
VWDRYIESHPKAAQFRNAPFPLYDDLNELCENVIATGAAAFNAAQRRARSESGSRASSERSRHHGSSKPPSETGSLNWNSNHDDVSDASTPERPSKKRTTTGYASSLVVEDRSRIEKSEPTKRRRPTHMSLFTDLNGTLQSIVGKLDEPTPPPLYVPPPVIRAPPPTSEEALAQAVQLVQDETSLSEEDQTIAIDLFIEKPKAATVWIALKPGPVRNLWINNHIIARRSIQPGLC